jgi:hypothetical protein
MNFLLFILSAVPEGCLSSQAVGKTGKKECWQIAPPGENPPSSGRFGKILMEPSAIVWILLDSKSYTMLHSVLVRQSKSSKSQGVNMRSIAGVCICAVALLGLVAPAFGSANLDVTTNTYHEGPDTSYSHGWTALNGVSGSSPACTGGPCAITGAFGYASGYADATRIATGIHTSASSFDNTHGADASATAAFQNKFTVTSTRLSPGSYVYILVALRLDGIIDVSAGADAHGKADFGIYDLSRRQVFDGGEFQQPEVLYFSGKWDVAYSGSGNMLTAGWQANLNNGFTQGGHKNFSYAYSTGPSRYYHEDRAYTGGDYDFDTGNLYLSFEAQVGTTYTVYGNITNLSEADGEDHYSDVDFLHTLGGLFNPDDEDVTLAWEVPLSSPAPVPLPSAMLLLAPGLAALAVVRRTRGKDRQ